MEDEEEYINEKELRKYPTTITYECTEKILEQMKNKVCNIKIKNGLGTGFFCKIPFPTKDKLLPVLITNNHILDEKILENQNIPILIYTKESPIFKPFDLNNRLYYTSKEYDVTLIEIKENKDGINHFLELDENVIENITNNKNDINDNCNNIYINENIYLIQYPEGKLSVSYGILDEIVNNKKYQFNHLCSTKSGSSGSPILNITTNKVFGIHKHASIKNNYNKGTFLNIPLKEFINQNVNNYNKINIINQPNKKVENNNIIENKEKKEEIVDIVEKKEKIVKKEIKKISLEEFSKRFHTSANYNLLAIDFTRRNLGNEIIELIQCVGFNSLKELILNSNKISDINYLENYQCFGLTKLWLGLNQISDISVLQKVNFVSLKDLNLESNNISDISVLEKTNFPLLENLNLSDNRISDINVLEKVKFPNIEYIYFMKNNIYDIQVLERVKFDKLVSINLLGNSFSKELFASLIEDLKKRIKWLVL